MKNELGIETCCENCENAFDSCYGDKEEVCQSQDYCFFIATTEAYKQRIKELQGQRLTMEEFNTIIDALQIAKEEFAFCPEEELFGKISKKIEQTLKNSEINLNK